MRIAFVHFTNTKNTGDLCSGPYRYFDFSAHEYSSHDVNGKLPDKVDLCILGGGALGYAMGRRRIDKLMKADAFVAWGVGRSIKGFVAGHNPRTNFPDWLALAGIRDKPGLKEEADRTYAPCPSCMSHLFPAALADVERIPGRVVAHYNTAKPFRFEPGDADLIVSNRQNMADQLYHMAKAEYVVTNSYHGALWGTWLGCKVVVYGPYSSKFHFMESPPVLVNRGQDLQAGLRAAKVYPGALACARTHTGRFVLDYLSRFVEVKRNGA